MLRSLAVMTIVLLALNAWGFSRLDAEFGTLTSGESRLAASTVLNLVMFGLSLIATLGTAFLANPPWPARSSRARPWRCSPGPSPGARAHYGRRRAADDALTAVSGTCSTA